jgi:hypothetical protein
MMNSGMKFALSGFLAALSFALFAVGSLVAPMNDTAATLFFVAGLVSGGTNLVLALAWRNW